nr:ATP-binding protein [Nocardiopsis mwathae]
MPAPQVRDGGGGLSVVAPIPRPTAQPPPSSHTRTFPGRPHEVARARHWVEGVLAAAAEGLRPPLDTVGTAVLLVSEAATNAVRHTVTGLGGRFTVVLHLLPGLLSVRVEDDGTCGDVPLPVDSGPFTESARGIGVVSRVAEDWGVLPDDAGVYFRLTWR